ncbi:SubName: Full=Uncharacterized protein {ECO:0000313/EMBL:CCA73719.1} [Serendipita indica DSM 11827]|nr:SubName: Full=Uncharacterized protein {ECO:0000313/EMBL:CCA73719.1} [Serendipita indica DSM 11827]
MPSLHPTIIGDFYSTEGTVIMQITKILLTASAFAIASSLAIPVAQPNALNKGAAGHEDGKHPSTVTWVAATNPNAPTSHEHNSVEGMSIVKRNPSFFGNRFRAAFRRLLCGSGDFMWC